MAQRAEPINAVVYAQYHLRGGLRNTLIGALLALVFVGGACVMALTLNPTNTRDVAQGAAFFILGLQWAVLAVYGTARVSAAVRQDVTAGLIESHRLTPNSPLSAAIGYVVGPPVQALALAAVLLLVGLAMCFIGGISPLLWLVGNGMTLAFALLLWTLVALIAFTTANAAVLPILAGFTFMSSALFMLMPAFAVLASPLAGRSVFAFGRGTTDLPVAYAFTIVAQTLLGGVLLLAVSRRYRNGDTAAFSVRLGLLLLSVWTAITVIGLAQVDLFVSGLFRGGFDAHDRLVAGLASSFLLALIPLTAIARLAATPGAAKSTAAARTGGGRMLPVWVLVVIAAVLAYAPAATELIAPDRHAVLRQLGTLAVALSMFAGLTFLMAWQFLAGRGGWAWVMVYLLLPNALPPLIDAAIHASDPVRSFEVSQLTAFSPVASLIALWDRTPQIAISGLVGQAALVIIPATLYFIRRRGRTAPTRRGFAVELTTPPVVAE